MTDNLTAVPAPPAALLPLALAAAWAEQAARVEEADPLRAALLREHAGDLQRALAAAPAPEAATPDPVAATVSALIGLAHDRYATARLARGQRSYERMYQLDGEAIGLAEAAREVRERLAPAWDALAAERDGLAGDCAQYAAQLGTAYADRDALAARLAGAEAERDEQAKLYDNALHSAIRARDENERLQNALTLAMIAAREMSDEFASLRAERDHLSAALAGDNEGVRLWMLDCGNLADKHRQEAASLRGQLDRLRIAGTELRGELDDLASHWEHEYASETGWPSRCARELREALQGGGDGD